MPSIVNGLFSARSGISSHGTAIAVIGDNISNASTVGYKTSRAEFADLVAGGQASGRIVGAGSTISAINAIFQQGTLEFTSRPLDLAVDGNGFFVVANDAGQRFYTRAGNFKVDPEGFITTQEGNKVLGFPADGTGALQALNTNTVSQSSTQTADVQIAGNLNASDTATTGIPAVPLATSGSVSTAVSYADLNASGVSQFNTTVPVFDSLGQKHDVDVFFYKTGTNAWTATAYAKSDEVNAGGTPVGYPRQIGTVNLAFGSDGRLTTATPVITTAAVPWNNGSSAQAFDIDLSNFTQYSSASNTLSITQDGQGVGSVTSIAIGLDGQISAILDNGQSAVIGTIGLVNFSNPEGLTRAGSNLLSQSNNSGEAVVGRPKSGTFGAVQSGSVELSTVDIASEFVKLITVQRGFQANSRIITTINELLNDIIQLA